MLSHTKQKSTKISSFKGTVHAGISKGGQAVHQLIALPLMNTQLGSNKNLVKAPLRNLLKTLQRTDV